MAIEPTSPTPSNPATPASGARSEGGNRIASMAAGLIGSEILKIAAEIRTRQREGQSICNLTVGDFAPSEFPIPDALRDGVLAALTKGETNYPPSSGVQELREAVSRFYARELGLQYPAASILIAGGARPLIYGTYRAVVDPGDTVVYPVPSWNNNHYCHMVGAREVQIDCGPQSLFLPTRDALVKALPGARLLCINSPLNPTGTAISAEALRGICEAVVEENDRRKRDGSRPLFLMYDHIYWMLCVDGVQHVTPPALVPEVAPYTILIDGISKAFAATGLRVGWAAGPADVMERMSALLGHVGAWAPRAEQVATVALLDDPATISAYLSHFKPGVTARLRALHEGFEAMRREGQPVESLPPMGAIYLTVRIAPFGKKTPAGVELRTNEDVRAYLLDAAGFAVVPFQAFGVRADSGWFRLSVGAVSEAEIHAGMARVAKAMQQLA
ncbi:MAG: aminotransferase class I/II-fold pyridoxal phosphate-dependent enzyme [Nannocystaceae bacterium]|nr:aminotransferase class I/II-fold pyridoxal phosphate-dependent enzyme [Nannocystaceae bacterium]